MHPEISIHVLREEDDPDRLHLLQQVVGHFYPRPPRGGRLCPKMEVQYGTSISIHVLREEDDSKCDGK